MSGAADTVAAESAIAAAVADAAQAGEPLLVCGNGTKQGMLRPVQAARSLSTRDLTGITLYAPKELVLSARAGAPLPEIQATLAEQGQHLIAEPPDLGALLRAPDRPQTIGGIVAANLSGPRRVAWGAMRDHVLGLRFVTGWGEAVHSGGRVLKNVTGLDLCKLLCGSHGTLGVITEITLKVLPAPEATGTLVLPGLDAAAGVAALSAGLGSPFGDLRRRLAAGAKRRRWCRNWPPSAALWRCCGSRISPVRRLPHGEAARHAGDCRIAEILGRRGLPRGVARGRATPRPLLAQRRRCGLARLRAPLGRPRRPAGRRRTRVAPASWTGAAGWSGSPAPPTPPPMPRSKPPLARPTAPGRCCARPSRCAPPLQVVPPEPAPLAAITRRVKAALDPRGILNPGRLYAGL